MVRAEAKRAMMQAFTCGTVMQNARNEHLSRFAQAGVAFLQTAGNAAFSKCAQAGVAAKPKKGDALFFYSQTPANELDERSLHAGCPVLRGDKWSATKWIRVNRFDAGWNPRPGIGQKPHEVDSL
jgi:hypothetical protein